MVSVEGEAVPLKRPIRPSEAAGAVEKWLVQVEAGMVESVQEVCRQGLEAYPATPRTSWVLQWPSQVVLAVSAIFWTQEVGQAMQGLPPPGAAAPAGCCDRSSAPAGKGALAAAAARYTSQLNDVVELVRGDLSSLNRCVGGAGGGRLCRRRAHDVVTNQVPVVLLTPAGQR